LEEFITQFIFMAQTHLPGNGPWIFN